MSDEYFVYGVYASQDELSEAYRKVQAHRFQEIIVARDTKAPVERLPVSIRNPYSLYLKAGGMAGFVIGGLAGAFNCPHIPYVFSYQVLTPIMAAVSAAVFGAYLGLLINGMIQSPDKPVVQPEVFSATIPAGSYVLGVTASGADGKRLAIDCLDSDGLVELIVRNDALDLSAVELSRPEGVQLQVKEVQLVA